MSPKDVKAKRREAHKITAKLRNLPPDELMLAILEEDYLYPEDEDQNKVVLPYKLPPRLGKIRHPLSKLDHK